MKKSISVILVLIMIFSLCSCSSGSKEKAAETVNVTTAEQNVDVDLTVLSSTMVYSEVSNMVSNPADYIGKTVKMKGTFATDENEMYYFCVIADATACCSQGLEFILKGDAQYPQDYPTAGDEISVVGRFESYNEGTETYYHLVESTLV